MLEQHTGWIAADGFAGSGTQTSQSVGGSASQRYICPMMCTPPSIEPGRCPVCAMELVAATSSGDGKSVTIEASAR
jgi:Cu(I)/Ag(I) efflux system membrane fusion protein